jgi:hypothetical protein
MRQIAQETNHRGTENTEEENIAGSMGEFSFPVTNPQSPAILPNLKPNTDSHQILERRELNNILYIFSVNLETSEFIATD